MHRTAVVALGGNAFTRAGQRGTYEELAEGFRSLVDNYIATRYAKRA